MLVIFQQLSGMIEGYISNLSFLPHFVQKALFNTIIMTPFLFVIYWIVELIERAILKHIKIFIKLLKCFHGFIAPLFALLPECSMGVIAGVLYSRKMVTRATLIAFLIICSDEAIPLLLISPEKIAFIIPLIFIKSIAAIIVAAIIEVIDFMFGRKEDKTISEHTSTMDIEVEGCCDHVIQSGEKVPERWYMHPFSHTFNMFVSILVAFLLFQILIDLAGSPEKLAVGLGVANPLQIIAVAAIGLISNCVISIFITVAFILGLISFPAFVAGMITTTGIGMYSLSKQNKSKREVKTINIILLVTAIITGGLIFFGSVIK